MLAQSELCQVAQVLAGKGTSKMTEQAISLDTVVQLATVSRRTLWRRVQEGQIGRCGTDERGRALLALKDVAALLAIRLEEEGDADLLMAADQGDGEAQNELGILCLEQNEPMLALHWFNLAAEHEHSDAMHYLCRLYAAGIKDSGGGWALEPSLSEAFMWLSRAAKHGHVIARAQLETWT